MYKVGILAKYWNERHLLPQWLSMLQSLSVDHIFLLNDGSTDNSNLLCEQYTHPTAKIHTVNSEDPHENYFEETWAESEKINAHLTLAYNAGCEWVIHLDIDEFPSIPMSQFINYELRTIPPNFGIYFPIMDMVSSTHFLVKNEATGFNHYPCPHLKAFGKHSEYRRVVDGLNLDQGVEGGTKYIMTSIPYLHMKYAFKHRRWERKLPLGGTNFQPPLTGFIGNVGSEIMPFALEKWYKEFHEPAEIW